MSQSTEDKEAELALKVLALNAKLRVTGPRPLPGTTWARLERSCRELAEWSWVDCDFPISTPGSWPKKRFWLKEQT